MSALGPVLEMAEIERLYDGEWVLLDEITVAEDGWVTAGRVVAHSADQDAVHREALVCPAHEIAVYFIGEPPWKGGLALSPVVALG